MRNYSKLKKRGILHRIGPLKHSVQPHFYHSFYSKNKHFFYKYVNSDCAFNIYFEASLTVMSLYLSGASESSCFHESGSQQAGDRDKGQPERASVTDEQ